MKCKKSLNCKEVKSGGGSFRRARVGSGLRDKLKSIDSIRNTSIQYALSIGQIHQICKWYLASTQPQKQYREKDGSILEVLSGARYYLVRTLYLGSRAKMLTVEDFDCQISAQSLGSNSYFFYWVVGGVWNRSPSGFCFCL